SVACASLAVLLLVSGAVSVAAHPIPEGPGLGAEADTLAFEAGAAFARLRAPVIEPSVEVRVLAPVPGVLPRERYLVDGATGAFRLVQPFDTLTTVLVRYRRLPTVEPPPRLRVLAPEPPDSADSARVAPPRDRGGESRVSTTGSISRGVVAGSNRDVSLTSGLRLDVSGDLAPGVTVQGALTDTDTPIVPEGTTQTLSDFDRVFVRVEGPRFGAQLGDVDLALAPTEFAPLRRKVQGATVAYDVPEAGIVRGGRVQTAFSAVRGRFRSQDLVLLDGVQGPYRLEGDRGEPFVLVVPGSEQVYWDAERLTRGRDYTVDYGTGEITFTAARLVTAERRATVDFEFSAGGFARTLSLADATADLFASPTEAGRVLLGVRVLREADAPGLGDALGLSDADLDRLAASGAADAVVPGQTAVPFEPESPFVLYTARDTTVAGETVRIFVPATAEADSVFRVRFTRVRVGEGSYRRAGQALNGILYEFAGPGGGDYVPFRVLPRPVSRTVLNLTTEAEVMPGVVAFGELAGSLADANTLSTLDARDDGGATQFGLRVDPLDLGPGQLSASVTRRVRGERFQSLDRLRIIDYARRWNLARAGTPFGATLDSLGEASTEARVAYVAGPQTAAVVEAGAVRLGAFAAERVRVDASVSDDVRTGFPTARYTLEAVRSEAEAASVLGSGSFVQQTGSLQRAFGRIEPGVEVRHEQREQRGGALPQDTLLAPTYRLLSVRPGVTWRGASSREARLAVEVRTEAEPLTPGGTLDDLADASRSIGGEAGVRWTGAAGFRTDLQATFRRTTVRDAFRDLGRQDAESVALRGTVRARPLARALDLRARYEALTERTPVLQEAYVLVGAEAGQFVWRDGEGEPRLGEPDGRQQVDEFFPETTPFEGTYLRTFVPSDQLFPAVGVNGRLALRLDGARLADGLGVGWGRLVDARASVEVRERSTSRDLLRVLLFDPAVLQQRGAPDAATEAGTIDGRFRAEGEVSVLPREARRGLRLGADHLTTTRRLAAGAETRLVQSGRAEGRMGLGANALARLTLRAERRRATSDAFATRTYDLRGLTAEPSVTLTPASGVSWTLGAVVSTRRDALATGASPTSALVLRVPAEARWATSARLSLTARAEVSVVSLSGGTGSGLALFELTDGRGPGTSGLGSLQATIGLTESIRATAVYDVRAPAEAAAIQTVRMSLSAVF
ncbi:MAG: hypothetical protein AAF791_14810, partial [Bacteroidota bacterium]